MTKKEEGPLTQDLAVDGALLWCDYDNDGRLDLFASNPNGQNQLFLTHGDGPFIEVTSGDPVEGDGLGSSNGVLRVGFDKDGRLDLRVQTEVGPPLSPNGCGAKSCLDVKCVGTVPHLRQVIPLQSRPA